MLPPSLDYTVDKRTRLVLSFLHESLARDDETGYLRSKMIHECGQAAGDKIIFANCDTSLNQIKISVWMGVAKFASQKPVEGSTWFLWKIPRDQVSLRHFQLSFFQLDLFGIRFARCSS